MPLALPRAEYRLKHYRSQSRPGADASPEEIMRFVAGEVAHYKQIRRLEVIDAIPKSAAGKILRRVLRDSART